MSDNRTYRIKANVGKDSVLNVNLNQDFKTFEVLSLKLDADNFYKFHTSKYGCVAGRVLANGNFGIPNAKISIFIKATEEDLSDEIISYLYPYKNTRTKNDDGIRYNLLPEGEFSDCYQSVGTFPEKRLVLDDNNVFEVYDKYYKYTTRSNESGDYMIFGVPVGEQTIHVDIDLSDIGILSQRPRDMVYKGYNVTQFENANMFKKDTNLDSLAQIISQNSNVYVYPYWGEKTEGDVAITRKDIEIQYKFEPTCIFMGSIITDEKSNAISKTCVPSERMGKMDRLTTGSGTIEMIRKKPDGSVEELVVQGNQLIDGNGVWCYQIPMNLDYVCTDEYGNVVPTDDPKKGIPTRARVRFRMSITEFESGAQFSHAAKTLVPNNPKTEDELDYVFGSKTLDDRFATKSFRDLFWNQVYSVKSYIPRFQQGNYNRNKRFSGIKEVNVNGANNPIPYNNMRVDISFAFTLQCAIFHILLKLVTFFNYFVGLLAKLNTKCNSLGSWIQKNIDVGSEVEKRAPCLFLGDGYCPDLKGWYFAPGCDNDNLYQHTWEELKKGDVEDTESVESKNGDTEKKCLTRNVTYFIQCTEVNMAMEYNVIQFDFYNDWINGTIYSPRWNADQRKKRSYLFGAIRVNPRLNACSEENFNNTRRLVQQCSLKYGYDTTTGGYTKNVSPKGCVSNDKQRCHKANGRNYVKIFGNKGGAVHREITSQNESLYYYKPCEWQNGKKRLLFATDIVLLGSLNENDGQGIPQTFAKLPSSTYLLPDALASTNIGAEGFLYGAKEGGHLCNKKLDTEGVYVQKVEGNFNNLVKWSRGSDDYEENPYDDSYPITESAGIDWGFSGPEQGSNDLSKLYFPGGHFLGISCTWSEVNVKSCINLSRICELGSSVSHRQSFVIKNGDTDYRYVYSVPTGLISGDEILDYAGRNEFATLNYNNLKTRYNEKNGLFEYDFSTIFPVNFNGELQDSIGNDSYNSAAIVRDSFKRTVEDNSKDYYKFRMGIKDGDDAKKKYLIDNGSSVSMPVYENSFYFYFGLMDGKTAMDRLKTDFYAECPSNNPFEPSIEFVQIDGDPCEYDSSGRTEGRVDIIGTNVENLKFTCYTGNTWGAFSTPVTGERVVVSTQTLYSGTKYTLLVTGDNFATISKTIEIGTKVPDEFENIVYSINNFTEYMYFTADNFRNVPSSALTSVGSISFDFSQVEGINIVDVIISNSTDKLYHILTPVGGDSELPEDLRTGYSEIVYGQVPGGRQNCKVWRGNTEYDVYIRYQCAAGTSKWVKYSPFYVSMPQAFDIIFGGNEDATYQKVLKNTGDSEITLDITRLDYWLSHNIMTEDVYMAFKDAITFRHSNCILEEDGIDVEIVNPDNKSFLIEGPLDILTYDEETTLSNTRKQALDEATLKRFYQPTIFNPWQRSIDRYNNPYYDGRYKNETAKEFNTYDITVDNFKIEIMPAYLPYYFRAVFNIRGVGSTPYLSLSIVNSIRGSRYESVLVNGTELSRKSFFKYEDELSQGMMERLFYNVSHEYLTSLEDSFAAEDMYRVDSIGVQQGMSAKEGEYDITILERANGRELSLRETVHFVGESYTRVVDGVTHRYFYYIDDKVKYYRVKKQVTVDNQTIDYETMRFRSYYNGDIRYLGANNNVITKDKKWVSEKDKNAFYAKNNHYYNPYFPFWNFDSTNIFSMDDYIRAKEWPKFIDTDERPSYMWSNQIFAGVTPLNLIEETPAVDSNYMIFGVYDTDVDPHSSKMTIIMEYDDIAVFNAYLNQIRGQNE